MKRSIVYGLNGLRVKLGWNGIGPLTLKWGWQRATLRPNSAVDGAS